MKKEKDQTIAELKFKIEHMESVYESILHVSYVIQKWKYILHQMDVIHTCYNHGIMLFLFSGCI